MSLEKFTWKANRVWKDEHRHNVISTQFESGKKQYRYKGPLPRLFHLEFEKQNTTKDDAAEIRQFFNARKGSYEPFLWDYVHDDDTVEEVTVRFAGNTLKRNIAANTVYSFSLTFEEAL